MRLFDSICETITRAIGLSALSQYEPQSPAQTPLVRGRPGNPLVQRPDLIHNHGPVIKSEIPPSPPPNGEPVYGGLVEPQVYWGEDVETPDGFWTETAPKKNPQAPGPRFKPPSSSEGFVCDYSAMKGWIHVGNADTRGAWLERPIDSRDADGGIFDVLTDSDLYWPTGVVRKYHLHANDHPINADGVTRRGGGKTFNFQYPGPRIEACWGDWLEITVHNHLKFNGTTLHFHGARQLDAFEHDGVNGITQCPIAPGDKYTYKFRVTQHGTSWYHSHYSLQYADGLAGPMNFYGPATGNYDEAIEPFLFGDWSHNSAFEDFYGELHGGHPLMQTTILNGRGFFNCSLANEPNCDAKTAPSIYTKTFERGRKYLLRLINTSTASTFVFSIDKHILKVISSDFVDLEPYYADSILVGIGQRYNVIVEARPSNELIPDEDQNYWIRIVAADMCNPIIQNNPLVGIIRYNAGSTKTPTTKPYKFSTYCADEPFDSLVPIIGKTVDAKEHPANDISRHGDFYNTGVARPSEPQYLIPYGDFFRWDMTKMPMWLNFSNPTINHVGDTSFNPREYALVSENYTSEDWVYIILSAVPDPNTPEPERMYVPIAHPVHLHGHDFVMLAQEARPFQQEDLTNGTFHYDNPPRRDTVLLPGGGYVAIGFQLDNPGIWIYHCHIAWHASSGFAMQIREREGDIKLTKKAIKEKDRVCKNWDKWFGNKKNWYDEHEFQEDSGV